MTILDNLGRAALLGAQRGELPELPHDDSALGQYLTGLNPEQPEALLLNAAGALSIYEQIGRLPRRLAASKSAASAEANVGSADGCSTAAAARRTR